MTEVVHIILHEREREEKNKCHIMLKIRITGFSMTTPGSGFPVSIQSLVYLGSGVKHYSEATNL